MIPFFTLVRQNKVLKKELLSTIREVLYKGIFVLGPKVEEFEREFAKYIGVRYAVGVASGTDALSLALLSLGVASGDEVVIPANSYPTAFAVAAVGAIPKLVDIDPATYNIDPEKIPSAITEKTKAIIPVHLYGQPADMEKIMEIGRKYRLPIIEDCAQAAGATLSVATPPLSGGAETAFDSKSNKSLKSLGLPACRQGRLKEKKIWRKVGSIGDIGCFSFYPTKNLGGFGDGGMVVTNNKEIAERVRLLRMYGEKGRYNSILLGRNSRLDELQAAILLVKLKHLDEWNLRRREIARLYAHFFVNLPIVMSVTSSFLSQRGSCRSRIPSYASKSLHFVGLKASEASLGKPSLASPALDSTTRNRNSKILLPIETSYAKHIYHLFVIRVSRRDELRDYLAAKGIQTAIHYPVPVHLIPSFSFLGYKKGDLPESEKACGEILSLPMFPELTNREVRRVAEEIEKFYKGLR